MYEIWKDIKGYEGYYQVSNTGKIKTLEHNIIRHNGKRLTIKEKILNGSKDTKGYLQVELKKDGKRNIKFIHRLVAETFIENPNNKLQVNHINGDKSNNGIDNLEWVTCSENIHHAWKNGLNKPIKGEAHGNHKLTDDEVRYIKEHYKPYDRKYGINALARKFQVSTCPIDRIVNGKGWKHI